MKFNGFRIWNLNLFFLVFFGFFGFIDFEEVALTNQYKKKEAQYWFWKSTFFS